MKKNIGPLDKTIRLLIAGLVAVLYFTNIITGTLAQVLGIIAAVFAVTAFISVCPLYSMLGISTCKTKK